MSGTNLQISRRNAKDFPIFPPHTCYKNKFGANWVEEEAPNVLLYPSEGSTSLCDARTLPE